jgi:hypothetical protein
MKKKGKRRSQEGVKGVIYDIKERRKGRRNQMNKSESKWITYYREKISSVLL